MRTLYNTFAAAFHQNKTDVVKQIDSGFRRSEGDPKSKKQILFHAGFIRINAPWPVDFFMGEGVEVLGEGQRQIKGRFLLPVNVDTMSAISLYFNLNLRLFCKRISNQYARENLNIEHFHLEWFVALFFSYSQTPLNHWFCVSLPSVILGDFSGNRRLLHSDWVQNVTSVGRDWQIWNHFVCFFFARLIRCHHNLSIVGCFILTTLPV